jgi:integrase
MKDTKEQPQRNGAKLPGAIWNNNGHWYFRAKLPGEEKRKDYPLCMPGSRTSMPSTKPLQVAEAAAWRIVEEAARKRRAKELHPRECLTVAEMCDRYVAWAKDYYSYSWEKKKGMAIKVEYSIREFREMYGERFVADLEHHDMLMHRDALIEKGLGRSTVNRRISTVKRMITWALDEDMIPALAKAELTQVSTLKRGRSAAKDGEPVTAAPMDDVEAVIADSAPSLGGMLRVMRLTGMRPGEACIMRWEDIERRDTIWIYRPQHHKNEWRRHPRVVVIGPRAQGIIAEREGEGEYVFSPRVAQLERYEAMRLERKTKVQPSQVSRAKEEPMKKPGEFWTPEALARSVLQKCKRLGIERWHPNQLRHNCATEVRRVFGINAARAVLGHFNGLSVTDRYSFEAAEDEQIAVATPAMIALG